MFVRKIIVVKIVKNRWISHFKQQVAESFDGKHQLRISYAPHWKEDDL